MAFLLIGVTTGGSNWVHFLYETGGKEFRPGGGIIFIGHPLVPMAKIDGGLCLRQGVV